MPKQPCNNQCAACPFRRTAAPGWLGSYDVDDVLRAAWHGVPFFCHTRTDYNRPDWLERAMENGKLCRGFLVFPAAVPGAARGRPGDARGAGSRRS